MKTANENAQATMLQPGIYFDSNRGIYISKLIQELALQHGWDGEPELDPDAEFYHEAADEAMEWLQEHRTPAGYECCYLDGGDWGVMEDLDTEEE